MSATSPFASPSLPAHPGSAPWSSRCGKEFCYHEIGGQPERASLTSSMRPAVHPEKTSVGALSKHKANFVLPSCPWPATSSSAALAICTWLQRHIIEQTAAPSTRTGTVPGRDRVPVRVRTPPLLPSNLELELDRLLPSTPNWIWNQFPALSPISNSDSNWNPPSSTP